MGADNSEELTNFIKSIISGIKSGGEGENFRITKPIKFNVAVAKIKEGGAGFKIHIVDAGGKYKAEEITRFEFEIDPIDPDAERAFRRPLRPAPSGIE